MVVDCVARNALPPMLTDDDRPPLTRLQVFWKQQDAPGKKPVKDI